MIPKKIHYCWFGGNPLSVLNQRCIDSWKKYCPEYELVLWNESNSDIDNEYCRQAIRQKKWAFVSDWVRFDVLHKHGGIYLDTDIELIRGFDGLLPQERLYGAWESSEFIGTAFIASPARHPVLQRACDLMLQKLVPLRRFVTSPRVLKRAIDDCAAQAPCEIFAPQRFFPFNPFDDGNPANAGQLLYADIQPDTVGIHHYALSWGIKQRPSLAQRIANRLKRHPDWRIGVEF
ncbi:glycosyltransferase family 32 protein [Janthinobacterium agaricidamnosum]|uniref:Glycosyltransferase sugar-binding region containing DXD motif family protein n=1 Tax=Janthinobacterium agaricidamnosum NBRC 102515 = DSM 9628 TaxID=1349767 RepID=W0VAI7_9BURK|nr:glycosyltransferase [Janthinobacterium agaricidamnosum]CDG84605.1 glycosyltransferase sugar-binding region containing DXD motif family protein [Janthinobacterium agaricidamnosum NBRC 102515 = DSM 9628]